MEEGFDSLQYRKGCLKENADRLFSVSAGTGTEQQERYMLVILKDFLTIRWLSAGTDNLERLWNPHHWKILRAV